MEKIWYVSINNTQEGPYSVEDLKWDNRITPDTLVWKQGFPHWIPIRDVPELKSLFKDIEKKSKKEELVKKLARPGSEEVVLDYQQDPNTIFWIVVVILALLYSLYQFYIFT
jgi:hypothetical protein